MTFSDYSAVGRVEFLPARFCGGVAGGMFGEMRAPARESALTRRALLRERREALSKSSFGQVLVGCSLPSSSVTG